MVGGDREEALFIARTTRRGDPWSGDVALPGGRREPADASDEAAAARETREEVGVDVSDGWRPLGRVADDRLVESAAAPLVLSIFAWERAGDAPVALRPEAAEVARAFWVDAATLSAGHVSWRRVDLAAAFAPVRRRPWLVAGLRRAGLGVVDFACVRFGEADALWGLTLGMVSDAVRGAGFAPLVGAGAPPPFAAPFRAPTPAASAVLRGGFWLWRRRRVDTLAAAGLALLMVGLGYTRGK